MNKLKKCREKAGMTQTALAIKLGIQPGTLCRYEQGLQPNKHNARRIAKALGCNPSELFERYEYLRDY